MKRVKVDSGASLQRAVAIVRKHSWLDGAIRAVPILMCGMSLDVAAGDLSAALSIDKTAQFAPDKLYALVTGTYSCGPLPQPQPTQGATFATVDGTLSQASGRDIAQGEFHFVPVCDGETQTFAVGVQPTNIPWHGGNARVAARLFVQQCDQFFVCESAAADSTSAVKIRGGQ